MYQRVISYAVLHGMQLRLDLDVHVCMCCAVCTEHVICGLQLMKSCCVLQDSYKDTDHDAACWGVPGPDVT